MARTRTLEQLREEARERAEMENSTFVTDDEADRYVNQAYAKLYGKLVRARGDQYFTARHTPSTVAANEAVTLPTSFFKLLRVDVTIPGEVRPRKLRRMGLEDLDRFDVTVNGYPSHYLIEGAQLTLRPIPGGVYPMVIRYLPHCPYLSNDSDTLDGVNGWEDYVVIAAALKMLGKEESSRVPELMAELTEMERLIDELSPDRDDGEPAKVQDVRRHVYEDEDDCERHR